MSCTRYFSFIKIDTAVQMQSTATSVNSVLAVCWQAQLTIGHVHNECTDVKISFEPSVRRVSHIHSDCFLYFFFLWQTSLFSQRFIRGYDYTPIGIATSIALIKSTYSIQTVDIYTSTTSVCGSDSLMHCVYSFDWSQLVRRVCQNAEWNHSSNISIPETSKITHASLLSTRIKSTRTRSMNAFVLYMTWSSHCLLIHWQIVDDESSWMMFEIGSGSFMFNA
jgi:hypothetical protein